MYNSKMFSKKFKETNIFNDIEIKIENYLKNQPFPHIVIDDLFDENILNSIINEFPKDLAVNGEVYNNKAEKKVTLNKTEQFSETTNNFINFLNSNFSIKYLQKLTSIKEL